MIHLFLEKRRVGGFKNFEELLEYFNRIENSKLIDYNSLYAQEKWNFIYYPYRKLSNHCEPMKDCGLTGIEREAYEHQLDLIEIYTGDSRCPYQIPVTSDLDILELMRDWCIDYCFAHDYVVFETFLKEDRAGDHAYSFSNPLILKGEGHRQAFK